MAPAKRQPMTARPRRASCMLASTSVYAPGMAVGERLAYAYGDLATQVTVYACHDQLGSVRRWRTPSKGTWGANEFEPYGEAYAIGAVLAPRDYALHEWDPALAVYRAPYRNYSPTMTRWTTRDPLGMIDGPNMYGYTTNPLNSIDNLGLSIIHDPWPRQPGESIGDCVANCLWENSCPQIFNLAVCAAALACSAGCVALPVTCPLCGPLAVACAAMVVADVVVFLGCLNDCMGGRTKT